MKKLYRQNKSFILLLALCGLIIAACGPTPSLDSKLDPLAAAIPKTLSDTLPSSSAMALQQEGSEEFATVMSVLTHPRCINCHPTDDQPRQRDDQVVHFLNVTRGESNHGGPVQSCETCHHEENNPYSLVPGAPHWGLAPQSMGWLGLSHAEIAKTLIDPAKNGNRSFDDLIKHMNEDALVLWGWEPGSGRTPIPVPHDEFVQALQTWLDAGAPIPGE